MKNEKCPLKDLEYGINLKQMTNHIRVIAPDGGRPRQHIHDAPENAVRVQMARKLKIMENEKHPLDDLKNDEIAEKREK